MKAFVIMPFSDDFGDVFKIGIKETAKELNIKAYRLDEELFDEGMLDKIYSEIENCDFLIADLSNKNPNVFYELGYAHAIGKRCILLTKSAENIPFDLKHKRHIVYGGKLSYLKSQLKSNLEWAKQEIESQKHNLFILELKSNGNLEVTEDYAQAHIDFTIEIENKSNRVSPEIHGIYIHSAKKWTIKQNGKNVANKKSDLRSYSHKYSLNSNSAKIPKKGFTQLEISTSRILAYAYEDEEIKDNYTIQGNLFIEIVTDKGSFTNKFPLSIYMDTLPF